MDVAGVSRLRKLRVAEGEATLRGLVDAGLDVLRLNMAHGSAEWVMTTVERIRKRLAARVAGAEGESGAPAAGELPAGPHLQQLLHKLSAGLNPGGAPQYLQWIQATVGQSIQMIPVDEVLFFISDEKYTRVQTQDQESLIRVPIKDLLPQLDDAVFWQIHRSTIVNLAAIASVQRDDTGRQRVILKHHPEQLEVSRSFAHLFRNQ